MHVKKIIYISVIFILLIVIIASYLIIKQNSLFDADNFNKKNYRINEIAFFEDIAFPEPGLIRKWESDIKVQIDTTNGISESDIKQVDNVISLLSPLIEPIKISKVESNGNLIVHLNLKNRTYKNAIGYATFTDLIKTATITNAEIFVLKNYNSIIMHEFLHAIGISHPQNDYPFWTSIGRNTFVILEAQKRGSKYPANSIVLNTWDEFDAFQAKSHNSLSEQEKKAIKMLYTSDFKSGLTKRFFVYKIGK